MGNGSAVLKTRHITCFKENIVPLATKNQRAREYHDKFMLGRLLGKKENTLICHKIPPNMHGKGNGGEFETRDIK